MIQAAARDLVGQIDFATEIGLRGVAISAVVHGCDDAVAVITSRRNTLAALVGLPAANEQETAATDRSGQERRGRRMNRSEPASQG